MKGCIFREDVGDEILALLKALMTHVESLGQDRTTAGSYGYPMMPDDREHWTETLAKMPEDVRENYWERDAQRIEAGEMSVLDTGSLNAREYSTLCSTLPAYCNGNPIVFKETARARGEAKEGS